MPTDSRTDLAGALAIVIVHYRCPDALRECLASLPECRVVVVDNSGDCGAPGAIINPDNQGFAAACNQGIRATTEPFVLLLNPDTVVNRAALEKLLAVMGDEHVGACGPRILHEDGSVQASWRAFPSLRGLVCDELGVSAALGLLGLRVGYRLSGRAVTGLAEVAQLGGSCLLLRRAALDNVGLLDERFFVYFEEVDLCLRLHQAGWRVLYAADAVITHAGGQSSKTQPARSLGYRYASLLAFFRKHEPRWKVPVLKAAIQVGTLGRVLLGHSEYRGICAGIWRM